VTNFQFAVVVPPLGGAAPPKGGTTNLKLELRAWSWHIEICILLCYLIREKLLKIGI